MSMYSHFGLSRCYLRHHALRGRQMVLLCLRNYAASLQRTCASRAGISVTRRREPSGRALLLPFLASLVVSDQDAQDVCGRATRSRCFPLHTDFGERIFTEAALARIADPVALAIRGIEWHATAQAWPAQGRYGDSARSGIVELRGGRSCEPCEQDVIVDFRAVCGTPWDRRGLSAQRN
jgi:hypothetical protein